VRTGYALLKTNGHAKPKTSGKSWRYSTKFEFVIDHETTRALGIEVPPAVLSIADEVVE
jgi:hypothetical protein